MARLLEALDDLGSGSGSSSGSGSGFGFDGPTVVELPERPHYDPVLPRPPVPPPTFDRAEPIPISILGAIGGFAFLVLACVVVELFVRCRQIRQADAQRRWNLVGAHTARRRVGHHQQGRICAACPVRGQRCMRPPGGSRGSARSPPTPERRRLSRVEARGA